MTTATITPVVAEPELRRELGLASATAVVAGECIAVGIFLTPAGMAKALGSPMWLLVVWLAVGAMTLTGALCYGELASRFPRAGGGYVYLQEGFGRRVAFLYGWMCLLVMDPGLTASLATGTAAYAAYIFHWSPGVVKLAGILAIWLLCFLNILSVRIGAGFLRWITWLKLGVLGLLIGWAIVFHLGSWSNFLPFVAQRPGSLPLGPALGVGLMAAFYSFGGWWEVSKIAGEVRDPGRTLQRAMILGVLLVTAVYILVSAVFLYLVPLNQVASDETFVAQVGTILFGRTGGILFAAIVVVCVLGGLAGFVMSAPRVYYAMAKDGLFLPAVARLHPKFGTPAAAIAIQGAIGTLLVAVSSFQQIVSYFIFVAVFFIGLAVAGLFQMRTASPSPEGAILTPGYPFTPIVYLAFMAGTLLLLALHAPRESALGVFVVLAGIPVYEVFERRRTVASRASADKGRQLEFAGTYSMKPDNAKPDTTKAETKIKITEDAAATGDTAAAYDYWRAGSGRQQVPGIIKCFGARPDFLRQVVDFSNTIHFSEGHLSRRIKEMIASHVSFLNRCPY